MAGLRRAGGIDGVAEMPGTAVILLDLQVDFLDPEKGRMPVGAEGSERVIAAANAVLSGSEVPGAVPVAVVNAFPRTQRVQDFFRRNAALAGSPGAALDPRIVLPAGTPVFSKAQGNAFSNPELHPLLQSKGSTQVCIVGVFAERCMRATALGARALGYAVSVPLEAIATNARWKLWFARRSMQAHGVEVPERLAEVRCARRMAAPKEPPNTRRVAAEPTRNRAGWSGGVPASAGKR
jgi:nicotinamidase-related amidase